MKLGLLLNLMMLISSVLCQTMDVNFALYHSSAFYTKPRGNINAPMNPTERYHNSGFYIKAYEGSLIELIFFNDKKFSIGEYLKVGAGLGYKYSPEFKHLDDNGDYSLGFGGVYGQDEIKAFGPVDKRELGYYVELYYGIQTRYKFNPEKHPMRSVGFRWYYAIGLNPILHHRSPVYPEGYYFNGAKSVYFTHEKFSGCIDWDLSSKRTKQSHHYFLATTLRKNSKKDPYKYVGFKLEYAGNKKSSGNFDSAITYQVNSIMFQFLLGRAIF